MTGRDRFLIILTGLMGMLAGGYFYLTAFAPTVAELPSFRDDTAGGSRFTVTGEQYGGCARLGTCPSFQLSANGAYRYRPAAARDEAPEIIEGTIPTRLLNEIIDNLADANLAYLAVPASKDTCVSFVDGVDMRYEIKTLNTSYVLDSCQTNFSLNEPLAEALGAVWDYIESPSTVYPVILEEGLAGYLRDKLQAARVNGAGMQ